MKITVEDEAGRQMSLETALTVIPEGHAILICPVHSDHYLSMQLKNELEARLLDLGMRALVVQLPVYVWAIADPNAPA